MGTSHLVLPATQITCRIHKIISRHRFMHVTEASLLTPLDYSVICKGRWEEGLFSALQSLTCLLKPKKNHISFYTIIRGKLFLLPFTCLVPLNVEEGVGGMNNIQFSFLPSFPGFWSLVVLISGVGK